MKIWDNHTAALSLEREQKIRLVERRFEF